MSRAANRLLPSLSDVDADEDIEPDEMSDQAVRDRHYSQMNLLTK